MLGVPSVCRGDAVAEGNPRPPPQGMNTGDVEELARRAFGLARVEANRSAVSDDVTDQLGQLADREVLADADVQ